MAGQGPWPEYCDGLMAEKPGAIDRRYPKYWWNGEGGIDFWVRPGVPIIALADGEIEGAGGFSNPNGNYFMSQSVPPDYGVVTTRVVNSDGTQTSLYYQHIIIAGSIQLTNSGSKGQRVKKGDIIGYGNPEAWIEMGVNVQNAWGGIWGKQPAPGAHVDPEPYLRALIQGYGSGTMTASLTGNSVTNTGTALLSSTTTTVSKAFVTMSELSHEAINNIPGFQGLVEGLDLIEQFQPLNLPNQTSPGVYVDPQISIFGIDTGIPSLPGLWQDANALNTDVTNLKNAFTLPADSMQALIVFVTANTAAALIRAVIILIGLIIIIALAQNVMNGMSGGGEASGGGNTIASMAAMAKLAAA